MSMAAASSKFSDMVGLGWKRDLIRWAWTWFNSLVVLHCCTIRVLGFSGNWVMVVTVLAGKCSVKAILFVLVYENNDLGSVIWHKKTNSQLNKNIFNSLCVVVLVISYHS